MTMKAMKRELKKIAEMPRGNKTGDLHYFFYENAEEMMKIGSRVEREEFLEQCQIERVWVQALRHMVKLKKRRGEFKS
jgi:hypothetical protein